MERFASLIENLLVTQEISYRGISILANDQVKINLGRRGSIILSRHNGIIYCRDYNGHVFEIEKIKLNFSDIATESVDVNKIISPITGKLKESHCKLNHQFKRGDLLCMIESMKMETQVLAPFDLYVSQINCKVGDNLRQGQVIASVVFA